MKKKKKKDSYSLRGYTWHATNPKLVGCCCRGWKDVLERRDSQNLPAYLKVAKDFAEDVTLKNVADDIEGWGRRKLQAE